MKKFKFNIKREVQIVGAIAVVVGLIVFTEHRQGGLAIRNISIKMDNIGENHYLEEKDVASLMQVSMENLKGASLEKVNLKDIEKRIRKEPFIGDADIYSDLKGNVVVNVELRRPIARIVRNDGPDGYIAEDGTVMPVSEKFNSRVILLSGSYMPKLLSQRNVLTLKDGKESEDGMKLMALLQMIREDEFWSAQIAQIDIDKNLKIRFFPQVGDEQIEFGKPDDLEEKFKKLMIFYKEILPRTGWNKYSRVNLEYEGQIIAE